MVLTAPGPACLRGSSGPMNLDRGSDGSHGLSRCGSARMPPTAAAHGRRLVRGDLDRAREPDVEDRPSIARPWDGGTLRLRAARNHKFGQTLTEPGRGACTAPSPASASAPARRRPPPSLNDPCAHRLSLAFGSEGFPCILLAGWE